MIPKIVKYGGTNSIAFAFDFILLLTLDYLFDLNRSILAGFCYLSGTIVSYLLAKNFVFNAGWLENKPAIEFSAYFRPGTFFSHFCGDINSKWLSKFDFLCSNRFRI